MLFSRSEGREVEPPYDTIFKDFTGLFQNLINVLKGKSRTN